MDVSEEALLSFDLGPHSFSITTLSPRAQRLFDQGLNWCYAFNQDEGLQCFKQGLAHDPDCAMLHWGVAYAGGPFYNIAWSDLSEIEVERCTALCYEHVMKALAGVDRVSPIEKALVLAISEKFQENHPVQQTEFDRWNDDYAQAMRRVHEKFPESPDVAALFVEAMMNRTPWQLWDVEQGQPMAGADTLEAIAVCEEAISRLDAANHPLHPALLHLHIHLLEMSPTPERAMRSAERLGNLCPDAGHVHHMPGHIYVLCGDYQRAVEISRDAISADRKYLAHAGPFNYYTTSRCHDLHLMMYASMMTGQYQSAILAADEMCENLSEAVISQEKRPFIASTMEGYFSMRMHVLVRFGKWQDIIDTPLPQPADLYCVSTAMHHYAKGVASAALKNFDAAEEHKALFYAALDGVPEDRRFFNNPARQTLGVGEAMLLGELAYHRGNHQEGFSHLREAVQRCDALHYSEPWPWMHPPRHALGALLMEQGEYDEAEQVYRDDLGLTATVHRCAQHPKNMWALHGLVECLERRKDLDEAAHFKKLLQEASAATETPIHSSCCCRGLET